MAKSLGQIHTVTQSRTITGSGQQIEIDLPGQLTAQLQRMVRCGTYHKVVGIDMKIDTPGANQGCTLSGFIRYYAPTKGRCDAFRGAFKAMATIMKNQGINMRDNKLYDFRTPLNDGLAAASFPNQATLDGVTGLSLNNVGHPGASVFEVHNRSQQPQYTGTAGDLFQPGFDTLQQSAATGTDFVLNDAVQFTGDANFASTEYETIPFQLTWTPGSTDLVTNFQWRPEVGHPGASVFEVHNRSQQPQYTGTAGDLFQPGFDTLQQSAATGTDFVLNDAVQFTGDANFASTEYETIPFQLTWTPGSTDLVTNFQWRPDPALFLAVLCGQLEVEVTDIDFDPAGGAANLEVTVMVSGWKSIMSDPKARRSPSKKKKK